MSFLTTVGSLLGAGLNFFQGQQNRRSAESAQAQSLALNREQFNRVQTRSIRDRVADAKAASLHPLYALGAASSGAAPTPFIPGQWTTGSGVGEGVAAAADSAARAIKGDSGHRRRLEDAQLHVARTQALKNEAEAQLAQSQAKRAEVSALSEGLDRIGGGEVYESIYGLTRPHVQSRPSQGPGRPIRKPQDVRGPVTTTDHFGNKSQSNRGTIAAVHEEVIGDWAFVPTLINILQGWTDKYLSSPLLEKRARRNQTRRRKGNRSRRRGQYGQQPYEPTRR